MGDIEWLFVVAVAVILIMAVGIADAATVAATDYVSALLGR